MAHGGSPEWNRAVDRAVEPLDERLPTSVAFGMADRETLERALRDLEQRGVDRVAVVRLFISGTAFLAATERLFGLGSARPLLRADRPIRTSSEIAIDTMGLVQSDEAAEILIARARSLSRNPTSEALLILGHGFGDAERNARLLSHLDSQAGAVGRVLPFRDLRVETLSEDWPEARAAARVRIRAWVEAHTRSGVRVLVVPYRLFGFGPYAEVLSGLSYEADETGLLPHPAVSRWLEARAVAVLCSRGWATRETICPGSRPVTESVPEG